MELDAAQRAVVEHGPGPLLVLAGPGTGKTTTLVEAVAHRVESGTDPERILTLTFSRKAALELRERIGLRLRRTTSSPLAWTFHAYCFALLRELRDPTDPAGPLRLLTGPQQEVAVRDLIAGDLAESSTRWPAELRAALPTRGFAREVRDLLARARELGLEPAELRRFARAAGRRDWTAAAGFFESYLDVLDALGSLDYAELVHRAATAAAAPRVQEGLRGRYDAVFVDEYQDTDPAQERLLAALAGGGRDLVVVGDPDQSIYAFRGADVSGLLQFPHRFPTADGALAPVRELTICRRSGPELLAVSRRVAARLPAPGVTAEQVRTHRDLRAAPGLEPGGAAVRVYTSPSAEARGVAEALRHAHLHDGLPWSRMAVLVRSAVRSLPLLRRVLGAAGVPVEVAGDELPLAAEPAVAPLLLALRVAAGLRGLDPETTGELLASPLVAADGAVLRRLGRELRAGERRAAAESDRPAVPGATAELLARCVVDPDVLGDVSARLGRPVRALHRLLANATEELRQTKDAEHGLWALWSASPWPNRLEAAALAGGPDGQAADRDLDAVLALFEAARRHATLRPRAGVTAFLDELAAQQIPADTLAERAVRGDAVRVLTAHRSKGLEWDFVVVCGVQETVWPDLRSHGSLLTPDRLSRTGLGEPPGPVTLLAEERRLFYVAVTRARSRLLVTAVSSADDDGLRPSRFLGELGVELPGEPAPPADPLTLRGLVARLRAAVADPRAGAGLRAAAAHRLARLAAARGADGRPFAPAAHPDRWWGLDELTDTGEPPWSEGQPLRLSGTSLAGFARCPLQWLFVNELCGDNSTSPALGIGLLIHQLAEEVANGRRHGDAESLMGAVDAVWAQLPFGAPWYAQQQHESVRRGIGRYLDWLADPYRARRQLVGVEQPFELTLQLASGPVRVTGKADRLEIDAATGRVVVVDLKTGTKRPRPEEVAAHPQLGTYQLAVASGAFTDPALVGRQPGGAELVQLRARNGGLVQRQAALDAPPGERTWIEELLADTAGAIRAERFPPQPGEACRSCSFLSCCPAHPEGQAVMA